MSVFVPSGPSEITPAWIAPLAGWNRRDVSTIGVDRIGAGFGLASEVFRVTWREPDPPRSVVVKLWSTDGVAGTREVEFYRTFGSGAGIRMPACHAADIDMEKRRGVLVLEDIRNAEQGDCLKELDAARAIELARPFARFHRRWWNNSAVRSADWLPSLLRVEQGPEWFDHRRALFLERYADRLDPRCRPILDDLESVERHANALLAGMPETLLHADLHLDNVLLEESGSRPVILDWARASRGPAALDLCEIAFHIGPVPQAEAVIEVYASELNRDGNLIERPDLKRALTGALLRRFITSTCGVAAWNPASPREERMIAMHIARGQDAILAWFQDTAPRKSWWL